MRAVSWTLLAHVVSVETWMLLVLPAAATAPLAALAALTVGAVVAFAVVVVVVAAVVVLRSALSPTAGPVGGATTDRAGSAVPVSVLSASGHGARAPGGSTRAHAPVVRPA